MSELARILSHGGNAAVLHLPGRAFPAIALQGDTFFNVIERIQFARSRGTQDECDDELRHLLADLNEHLALYEQTLRSLGLSLPYRA